MEVFRYQRGTKSNAQLQFKTCRKHQAKNLIFSALLTLLGIWASTRREIFGTRYPVFTVYAIYISNGVCFIDMAIDFSEIELRVINSTTTTTDHQPGYE